MLLPSALSCNSFTLYRRILRQHHLLRGTSDMKNIRNKESHEIVLHRRLSMCRINFQAAKRNAKLLAMFGFIRNDFVHRVVRAMGELGVGKCSS